MTIHIMLVEDNPSDVELVRTAFEEMGIAALFTVFRDGDEAILGIQGCIDREVFPDLVLLDLNLPRTSGHDVLTMLRTQPSFIEVPVIVFSTSNHPADRSRCMAAGADDYQVKPPHFQELLEFVARIRDRWLAGVV